MFSVHQAASIFYYLGMESGQDPERALLADSVSADGKGNYYDPMQAGDPLWVQATWTGKLAAQLGLPDEHAVAKSALAAMWFGIDPRDGKTPLTKGGPSIADQVAAQKEIAGAEDALRLSLIALGRERARMLNDGVPKEEVDASAAIEAIRAKVDDAKARIKKAKASPGHHQDAHDCVFSAPKGVSVYWARLKADGEAGDAEAALRAKALEKAVCDAARSAIEGYIEPQLLFWRSRGGGNKAVEFDNVKGIAAALFPHFDARPTSEEVFDPKTGATASAPKMPDPQMHVHALLMSMGLDHSDEVRALWTTFLGSHAKAIGAAFRGELAAHLRAMGLDVRQDEQDKIHSFDLAGVDDAIKGAFSARAAQVEANAGAGMGRQDAKLAGRETKAEHTGAQLLADWSARMGAMGLTAQGIASTTNDALARAAAVEDMERLASVGAVASAPGKPEWEALFEAKRAEELAKLEGRAPNVDEAVERLLDMESAFTMTDIARLAFESSQFCHRDLAEGQTPMQWAEAFRASILRHPELKQIHGADRYGRPSFTSRGLVRREKALYYDAIPKLLADRGDAPSAGAVDQAIADYERTESDKRGALFELRDFQKQMAREIALSRGSIHIALAPAGSGKTTTILGSVLALESAGFRVFSLAPSNKAAQGLASELRKASKSGMSPQKLLGKIRRGEVELTSKDVLLVDEASMLAFDQAEKLVLAALSAKGGPAKIILMGDTEQLPAVGRGNFLRALAESERFDAGAPIGERNLSKVASSAAHWSRINRQRGDLAKQATAFFALGDNGRALEIYERMGALRLSATREEALSALAHDAYLPLSAAAADLREARAEREERHIAMTPAMAKRAKAFASTDGAIDPEAVVGSFPEPERAAARQWFEDRAALEAARRRIIKGCESTLMLATKNSDVDALNAHARRILKSIGALGGADGKRRCSIPRGKGGSFEICEGERLVFTEAAGASSAKFSKEGDEAAKSAVGTVVAVSKTRSGSAKLVMELDGAPGRRVAIDTARFDKFAYAYGLSVHASQGATCSRVFEYASDFASKQTDYVGKSRHRDGHAIYGVESTYELHKKRAAEAIEKSDAKDLAFAAESFGLAASDMDGVEAGAEASRASADRMAKAALAARLGSIAQGALIDSGDAPLGFREGMKPSHFARLSVEGREIVLWGSGLRAELERLSAAPGDHIGLEALEGARASGEGLGWSAHAREDLDKAGLLLDADAIASKAREAAANRGAAPKADRDGFEALIESCFLAQGEAEAIFAGMAAKSSTLAARRAAERGALAELDRRAELPVDVDERVARAAAALPFAKRGAGDQIRELLRGGIATMPYERPVIAKGREWLAHDGELAFCATEWGTLEAWSSKGLPESAMDEARAVGGSIERIERRRQAAADGAMLVAVGPVAAAFAALGRRLAIGIVEHAEHGLCVGINAAEAGAHRTDPDLKKLFTGEGEYGMQAAMKKNGIGGLPTCKGFDPVAGAWLFPLRVDEMGAPAGEQRGVAELVELGERLGHSSAGSSAWDMQRQAAWEAIEARLRSPWGRVFEKSTAALGVDVDSALQLAMQALGGAANDIVRWNAAARAGDAAQEWEFCSTTGAGGEALGDARRRLAGIVLHATDADLFILRGQRIVAVERDALGAEGAAEEWIGRKASILFEAGTSPVLESFGEDRLMRRGSKLSGRIASGSPLNAAKMPRGAAAALARSFPDGPLPARDLGFAIAWALAEADELDSIKASRLAGMGPKAAGAELIEAFGGKRMDIRKAKVIEVGPAGALFEASGRLWLADKDQSSQALGPRLTAGQGPVNLLLRRTVGGRCAIDAKATLLAARAALAR